jgi:hypothetical protein
MCVGRSLARLSSRKGNDQSTKCLIESQDDWKQSTSILERAESNACLVNICDYDGESCERIDVDDVLVRPYRIRRTYAVLSAMIRHGSCGIGQQIGIGSGAE